jgi:hypothetical protein
MPVKTRSQKQQQQQQYNNSAANQDIYSASSAEAPHSNKRPRRVKVVTHSFIEANTRTYKVYSPRNKPQGDGASASASKKKKNRALVFKDEAADDAAAVQALLALQTHDYDDENNTNEFQHSDHDADHDENPSSPSCASSSDDPTTTVGSHQHHKCLNPMNPISKYIYRIGIYNIAQTVHYKTAYILYDSTSRFYHVYTIISNQMPHQENVPELVVENRTEFTLPSPRNTIQTKYKSYIDDTITKFVMTMIVPSDDHDYYIQDDILGVVIQPHEFQKKAFGEESSFYDIEDLVYDDTSSETTNGYKAFMLIPSRNYWYTPSGAYYYTPTEANTVAYRDNRYTPQILDSILSIISQSC